MNVSRRDAITERLLAWRDGSDEALRELIPVIYGDLRRMARAKLRGERPDHSLQPTALTHEVFLRLFGYRQVSWRSRAHFFGAASQLMRRILIDHARKRRARRRGGAATRVVLSEATAGTTSTNVDLLALDEALDALERIDPRQCRVVELRYFGGLNTEEAAEVLGISPRTLKRDWQVAKLWLRRELQRSVGA